MEVQENDIVQAKYKGKNIYYATPLQAILGLDGQKFEDYLLSKIDETIKGVVLESAETTNGRYIKFTDGTLICMKRRAISSCAITTAISNHYRTSTYSFPNFPHEFIDIPEIFWSVDNASADSSNSSKALWTLKFPDVNNENSHGSSKTNPGRIAIASSSSFTCTKPVSLQYIAIGRWKNYEISLVQQESTPKTLINSPSNTYSRQETVIGLWEDKKPLYRRTIYLGPLPSTTNTEIYYNTGIVDDISVKDLYGTALGNTTSNTRDFPLPFAGPNPISIFYRRDTKQVSVRCNLDRSNFIGYLTLEYTKDNDTPVTSTTADVLTLLNGQEITDLDTIIHNRISELVEEEIQSKIAEKLNEQVLWTNPSPKATFTEQNVTLSSPNYKYLTFYYYNWVGGATSNGGTRIESVKIPKGYNVNMTASIKLNGGSQHLATRGANYVNETTYKILGQQGTIVGGALSTDNQWIIPIMIVGSNI